MELTDNGIFRLGLIFSIQARIDGMKIENQTRFEKDFAPLYNEEAFIKMSEELENISHNEIVKSFEKKDIPLRGCF